jgi:murein DD-endopeptidase MepM/ murein hydrolase activator NlpD
VRRIGVALAGLLACGIALAARAEDALTLSGGIEQGGLVRGIVPAGAKVSLEGQSIRVAADGHFIFGFGRDAPEHAKLVVTFPDGRTVARDLAVAKRSYDVQSIKGLPPEMVTPDAATLARIKREAELVRAARAESADLLFFEAPLEWPVTGTITGIYGSQRILNGEPRAPHLGVDVAAPTGTPVKAAAGGNVVLAEPDLYFTGGTVIIDHGYGLNTVYVHLQKIAVTVGQELRQGETLGELGATGRTTGANLHWGVNWFGVALDPARIAGPMPKE